MQRAEAEKLLKEDPRRREHIRGLLRIGRLFSLRCCLSCSGSAPLRCWPW